MKQNTRYKRKQIASARNVSMSEFKKQIENIVLAHLGTKKYITVYYELSQHPHREPTQIFKVYIDGYTFYNGTTVEEVITKVKEVLSKTYAPSPIINEVLADELITL